MDAVYIFQSDDQRNYIRWSMLYGEKTHECTKYSSTTFKRQQLENKLITHTCQQKQSEPADTKINKYH